MSALLKTNEYSASLRILPEEKLREYIENPEIYQDDAVIAAIWELERRRPLRKDEKNLLVEISDRFKFQNPALQDSFINEFKTGENDLPSLYSVRSIQVFSVLFSVLAGGILMAINFSRTTQKVEAVKVLTFSLAYTLISVFISMFLGTQSPLISLILNLLGAFLIYELFWKRVLGIEFQFKKQQVWTAMVVALLLISPLIWYLYKTGAFPAM
jgi:hypothetical protein